METLTLTLTLTHTLRPTRTPPRTRTLSHTLTLTLTLTRILILTRTLTLTPTLTLLRALPGAGGSLGPSREGFGSSEAGLGPEKGAPRQTSRWVLSQDPHYQGFFRGHTSRDRKSVV